MSVRYYLSQVLSPDPPSDVPDVPHKDYYRLALDDVSPRVSFAAHIPHTPNGRPAFAWGVAFASGTDWSGVDVDPRNVRLFDGAEGDDKHEIEDIIAWTNTARWSDLRAMSRTRIRAALSARGVPVDDISSTTSMRAILQKIGRFLDPDFNELKLFIR